MRKVIHARVLKLAADFDEVQGLADAAKEKRKAAAAAAGAESAPRPLLLD